MHAEAYEDQVCFERECAALRERAEAMKHDIAAWSLCGCRACTPCIDRLTQHITEADQDAVREEADS